MLQNSKLSEYLKEYPAEWVPDMPVGVPPDEICIPKEHSLFRLIKEDNVTQSDIITYYENDPNRDWGDKLPLAYAVSMFDDIKASEKLKKLSSLKDSKAIAKFILNPENGVVKQTVRHNHYSWWKTKNIDITTAQIVKRYENVNSH